VCTPDCASHARPWLLESQNTLNIVSVDLLARDRVDDRRLDTKEWKGSATWLSRCDTSERSDDIGASLGLPVCLLFVSSFLSNFPVSTYINNVSFSLSNNFEVPLPDFRSDWLSDGSQDSEMLHLVLDVLVTSSLE
jgi:hypothetical protein